MASEKIEREDAIRASCYTMQGKWLVKRTGKLYIKIWRLVEGFMLKGEKEKRRKTANYAKVKRRMKERERQLARRQTVREKKDKRQKKIQMRVFKFLLI